jgi:hypothetical protein
METAPLDGHPERQILPRVASGCFTSMAMLPSLAAVLLADAIKFAPTRTLLKYR